MGRGIIRIQTIRAAVSFQEKEGRHAPRLNSRIHENKTTAKTYKRSNAEYDICPRRRPQSMVSLETD